MPAVQCFAVRTMLCFGVLSTVPVQLYLSLTPCSRVNSLPTEGMALVGKDWLEVVAALAVEPARGGNAMAMTAVSASWSLLFSTPSPFPRSAC